MASDRLPTEALAEPAMLIPVSSGVKSRVNALVVVLFVGGRLVRRRIGYGLVDWRCTKRWRPYDAVYDMLAGQRPMHGCVAELEWLWLGHSQGRRGRRGTSW